MEYVLLIFIYFSGGVEIHTQSMNDELSCKLAAISVKAQGVPDNLRAYNFPEVVSFCVVNGVEE